MGVGKVLRVCKGRCLCAQAGAALPVGGRGEKDAGGSLSGPILAPDICSAQGRTDATNPGHPECFLIGWRDTFAPTQQGQILPSLQAALCLQK
jgi:hypothetical protein